MSLVLVGDNLPAERGSPARAHVGVITGCDRPLGVELVCPNRHPGQWCLPDGVAPF